MASRSKGLFISFEGGEGTGKSTQIEYLAARFRALGREVLITREPGGNAIADKIRALLLSHDLKGVHPLAELMLYEASRAEHTEHTIRPALKRNAIVLTDRYADSSIVYQGAGRKIKRPLVEQLNKIATGGLKPHLTFIFDMDPREALLRAGKRGKLDRLESEGIKFHLAVRQGYRALARRERKRCFLLQAATTRELVSEKIQQVLSGRGFL